MTNNTQKQYVGISRDHSGSMQGVAKAAMLDYNELIAALKENTIRHGVDTVASVVECGIRDGLFGQTVNRFDVQLSSIAALKKITDYAANGNSTPLFDSVAMLIEQFKKVPDYNNPNVSFLLMICTDGGDNASFTQGSALARTIRDLEATDKWTVTFRVPKGYKLQLTGLGINSNNILEFDAGTEQGFTVSTVQTKSAVSNFYATRATGQTATRSFYHQVDTSQLDTKTVRQELTNISKKVRIVKVNKDDDGKQIRDLVEEKTGQYVLGSVYYQLTKKEKLQDHKKIIVWDKLSGEYYTGAEAKNLLGLSHTGEIKIAPASFPQFEVFVQSTSVNRKLVGGTKVVVYQGS